MNFIELQGNEIALPKDAPPKTFWLIKKYSSYSYIERMYELYRAFVKGYEEYATQRCARKPESNSWFRKSLQPMYSYQSELDNGLSLLKQGYTNGYVDIAKGCTFGNTLLNPRYEYGLLHEPIGYRTDLESSVGLFSWAAKAIQMSGKVELTITAQWAYPKLLARFFGPYEFPNRLDALKKLTGPQLRYQSEVPVSGIWLPLDIPNGCPNYLRAGTPAPQALRAWKRYYENDPAETTDLMNADYAYKAEPTDWALLWEDERYRGGVIPDESEYLDSQAAFPPYPPHP